jgi:hypothetical protein
MVEDNRISFMYSGPDTKHVVYAIPIFQHTQRVLCRIRQIQPPGLPAEVLIHRLSRGHVLEGHKYLVSSTLTP